MSNIIEFYDIASKTDGTFSPNTYKTRYLLHYKGLPYKRISVQFPDIKGVCEKIGATATAKNPDGSPLYTFPVIRDLATGVVISDSLPIAEYLEKQYPDKPTLIPAGTTGLHRAHDAAFKAKLANFFPLLLPKVPNILNEASMEFFIRTRKERLGVTPAEMSPKDPVDQWKRVEADLEVVAGWYNEGDQFIGGKKPVYADFVIASWIMFARVLYGADSPEWKNLSGTFQGGRWGRLLESLKEYE
ncbi:hypothetical protein E1B28_011579 [Marasmius oreades]|uniref:GST N-terminal domain-containing protein n=1 Tax=Marasmius oreades TaxID=181124 RepID=A0A9P7RUF5_9AGAR|nr:uncharacterized protein E1B28_011579 [Marasmius oreades]KAG7089954.1 hypothetical protein E1B28_011579 [Marasmius oreades]